MLNAIMKLKGKVSITRQTSDGKDRICITLHDSMSHCDFVEATLSLADFASAITAHSVPCAFELHAKYVGFRSECKTVPVRVPNYYNANPNDLDKICRKAVKAHEVDGWKGLDEDAKNHHKRVGPYDVKGPTYSVRFFRYVDDNGKPVE